MPQLTTPSSEWHTVTHLVSQSPLESYLKIEHAYEPCMIEIKTRLMAFSSSPYSPSLLLLEILFSTNFSECLSEVVCICVLQRCVSTPVKT